MSWGWWLVVLGITDVAGRPYAFYSGSGSIILPWLLQALTIGLAFWIHHQCHVHRCWRYARRATAAGERACRVHHPSPRRTAEDIRIAHHAALAGGPGETR